MNEDQASKLISKTKRKELVYWKLRWKEELEPIMVEHSMISRFYERMWFQKMRAMTKDELLTRYRHLAYLIEWYEKDIDDAIRAIGEDYNAREALQTSMKPFEGLNMKEIELVQQELF